MRICVCGARGYGHFVLIMTHLGESFFVSTEVRVLELLAVSMPPSKVCPQCTAAVPVRRKTCLYWKKSSMHF